MTKREALLLLSVFVLSLLVRGPLLTRPLSAHHEYCTAFTLVAISNWFEDGFSAHHGVPSGGYVREGDAMLLPGLDRNERAVALYYFSHPPFAFDLPYLLFKVTGTNPSVIGLRAMNLFFHLVSIVALFFALRWAWPIEFRSAALHASLMYSLLPTTLWFHSNAYMSDIFVQVPWLVHLALAIRIFRNGPSAKAWEWAAFGVSLFFTVYTSWLGVFAGLAAMGLAAFRWYKDRGRVWVRASLMAIGSIALALGITFWRYIQVIDPDALLAQLASRFALRGSVGTVSIRDHMLQLLTNYRTAYLPLVIILLFGLFRRGPYRWPPGSNSLLVLAGLPVLLDHLILLPYAEHDFAVLKAAPLFCAVAALFIAGLEARKARSVLAIVVVLSVLYFYRQNPLPGNDGGRYDMELEIGRTIAGSAAADEAVFAIGLSTEPQVTWYAKRNVTPVASVEEAREWLRLRGRSKGVVFFQQEGKIGITHLR